MPSPRYTNLTYSDPDYWPSLPNPSRAALAVPPEVFWKRVEHYCGDVFTPRPFSVEINCDFRPVHYYGFPREDQEGFIRLPVTNPTQIKVEKYRLTPPVGWQDYGGFPDGADVLAQGRYRVTGIAGHERPPAAVLEAVKRFAEYTVGVMQRPEGVPAGVESYSVNLGGSISEAYRFNGKALGGAMIASGAADLLRPYRKGR